MANRLFDAPDFVEVVPGDGMWSIGFDLQASTAATTLLVQDPCSETGTFVAGAADASSPKVYTITAFSATVSARRNIRCSLDTDLEMVSKLLQAGGAVSAAEYVLWNGMSAWDPNAQPSLHNNDVQTSTTAASIADTISNAIVKYSQLTVLPDYIVHLGVDAAIDLSALGYTETIDASGQLRLRATGAPIVVSPNYPASGVAVTGPIVVNIGEIAAYQAFDFHTNRTNILAYQLIALAFDPSTSIRAV